MNRIRRAFDRFLDECGKRRTIREKLRIYRHCVRQYTGMETVLMPRFHEEKWFHLFAFLLQIVSFFTTYAGVAMYFGNVFDLAPLFIALTIQGVLYLTAVSAFEPGRRNRKKKTAMLLCTLVSVAFSYTGLVTLASSPMTDYQRAYNSYRDAFTAFQSEASQDHPDEDSLAADISNEFLKAIGTLETLDRQISQLQEKAQAPIDIPVVNKTTQTTTMPDGTVIRGNTTTANPEYAQAAEERQQASAQANALSLARQQLYLEILDAVGAEKQNDLSRNSYDDIRTAVRWEKLAERIRTMGAGEDSAKELQNFRQAYFRVANRNNSMEISGYTMEEGLLDRGLAQLEKGQRIASVTLAEWDEITKVTSTQRQSGAAGMIQRIAQAVGADLYESDMKELMDICRNLKEAVAENYSQVEAALPGSQSAGSFKELTGKKEQVEALPEVLVLAFERFGDTAYAGSALCCLLLAILNDFSTVLLGYLGTRRIYSLPGFRRRKDNPHDGQDLFPLVFTALQSQFLLQIRTEEFLTSDTDTFTQECANYVSGMVSRIRDFLAAFTLSPCTAFYGYRLALYYENKEEIAAYLPIITALMKVELLKVLPASQYEYLEMEYYLGKTGHLWEEEIREEEEFDRQRQKLIGEKESGHILLLRSQAENYLRGKLADAIILEGKL